MQLQLESRASKKNKIAICGYHGWHDWYLAANLKIKNLEDGLMKGLKYSVFLKI